MTIDIKLGTLVIDPDTQGYTVDWPNVKPAKDGSSKAFNRLAGLPYRQCSISGFQLWLEHDRAALQIYRSVKRNHPDTQDPEYAAIDSCMIEMAKRLYRASPNPVIADRARWLYFWMTRARQAFGSAAMIQFS